MNMASLYDARGNWSDAQQNLLNRITSYKELGDSLGEAMALKIAGAVSERRRTRRCNPGLHQRFGYIRGDGQSP